jgi:tetratricopeptide (TPR) repeat protein
MFALICLRLTFRYLDTRKTSTLLALHVCFFLSMFSKETSALIPLMIVGAWWLFYPRRSETGKTILTCLLPCVIPIGLFFVARSIVIPKFPAPSVFGIGPFLNNLRVIPETIGKFFIPVGLAPLPEFTTLVTILGLGVATLLIVASLWRSSSNQRRLVLFGFGWFLLFTIPGTAYTNELGTIAYDYLEHRSYLPMIGIAFVLATILSKAFEGGRRESALMVVSGLAVLFAVLSYIHAQNYKNAELFYDMAIDGNPNSGMSLLNRGYLRAMKNDVNGAMRDYTQATIVTPTYAEAFVNRGVLYQNMNRMQDAGNDFKKAVELNPKLFAATYNLANWYGRHDDIRKALRWYQQSMELKPTHAEGWAMIGSIKAKLGDINGALPNFERALSVNPNLTIAFVNRGKALYNVGRTSEACADWSRGAALGDSEAASLQKSLCK